MNENHDLSPRTRSMRSTSTSGRRSSAISTSAPTAERSWRTCRRPRPPSPTSSAEPPPALRERILEAARSDNGKVVQFPRRRWLFPATAAAAAAAAVVAIGVGLWASSLSRDLDRERSANAGYARALQLLGGGAEVTQLADAEGGLLVAPDGEAALVVCGLQPAPEDKTYEAWVIEGETPRPAGLFRGGGGCPPVLLERAVPKGSQVAVTLEPRGGVDQPTGPLVRSEAV